MLPQPEIGQRVRLEEREEDFVVMSVTPMAAKLTWCPRRIQKCESTRCPVSTYCSEGLDPD